MAKIHNKSPEKYYSKNYILFNQDIKLPVSMFFCSFVQLYLASLIGF